MEAIKYIASFWPQLPLAHWFWLMFCGVLIGMAKGGVKGLGLVVVPVMAAVFGGKASTGIVLPMLMMADVMAVRHYHPHVRWPFVISLLPAALLGIALGIWVGRTASDSLFDQFIVAVVLLGLVLMLWQEWRPLPAKLTNSRVFFGFF